MINDDIMKKVKRYIKIKAGRRSIVMFGVHDAVRNEMVCSGIHLEGIFTGNLDLLAKKELGCLPDELLNGNSKKYYIVIPFFLPDGGVMQREKMKKYGYKEIIDYVFYPDAKKFTDINNFADLSDEILTLKETINELNNKVDSYAQTNRVLEAQNEMMLQFMASSNNEDILTTKKRLFRSLPPATGTLRAMQKAGIILLAKLNEVCRNNGIPYWISFGTLLGAIRHGGFIPWDDDTDICMLRKDAERLSEVMKDDPDFFVSHIFAEFDDNLNHCVQFKYKENDTPYCLDIFLYDYCSELSEKKVQRQMELNKLMAEESQDIRTSAMSWAEKNEKYRELLNKYLNLSQKELITTESSSEYIIWALDNYRCRAHFQGNCRLTDIFPLNEIMFEGLKLYAPNQTEKYVEIKYGDIYSFPSDMFRHKHFNLSDNQIKVLDMILEKHRDRLIKE